ncbi:hypothetical protein [Bacillus paramobilis]|uniref:hypothetical protein n=1 Tax=Bacillus paramobilis TaxID=2817477 RepID=UPI001BB42460|nr:hypothetical protein [Bacillus paramobilis]HEF5065769.1 hypothetical protein [Bacillus cereus]HEF5237753.1 hypothetical protein [Bacillus cereus]
MDFKKGDKIKFIKMYKEYGIVKASKSSTGTIQGFVTAKEWRNGVAYGEPYILIKLTKNQKLLRIPANDNLIKLIE